MRYIPHTDDDIRVMLSRIGLADVSTLFDCIPKSLQLQRDLDIPPPLSEPELERHLSDLAARNGGAEMTSFLGGGAYRHHSPAAINQLLLRGEFFTAYTPYQAEVAQGTLQSIFEFQTMISRLFGLDVANASMYDGASATAEAVLMAARLRKGRKVLVAASLNPAYRAVIDTYTQFGDLEVLTIPHGADGRVDRGALASMPVAEACAVVVASPNFFGVIEDLAALRGAVGGDTMFVTAFSEPLAYALLRPPGACGADIAAGEGASFGLANSFGGPYLGLFATKKEFVRSMPGRLAGETVDTRGERGYVLTLSTREQHIRREKATSNICTNQALCALAASIYLSLHGKAGLPALAKLNRDLAESAKAKLVAAGATLRFDAPTFNEFVVRLPRSAAEVVATARDQGLIPGLPLAGLDGFDERDLLVCVTELNTIDDIDRLARIVREG